ncbi:glycosyltransferase [Aromatoleum toluvorans]|uniref:Glycosyltransferase n=1 Tax=Aromatoleum toluvorans TaxID=92002 RepID=A0ABX1PWM4_9RHOO|nr:glycosyltransferase family 2 protein [Aromatoleum toluvorans]NMG43062.1 glycosyltransferase [Aromatoleum toluvorans]
MTRLAVVVPCYNEAAVLPDTARRLLTVLADLRARGKADEGSALYFVDDGSSDGTWQIVEALAAKERRVQGIKLSRNCGHQNALLAGLFSASGDAVITIDADLQDDPEAISGMLDAYHGGADVVYGVRRCRTADSFFKRFSAEGYYWLLERLGVEIIFNHADFRLLSRRAIDALKGYDERNIFLRGVVPRLGFNSAMVHYDRTERPAGETKYPLGKMVAFALEGVTSFSAAPLRAITLVGFVVSLLSFAGGLWALWERLVNHEGVPGWASTLVPMFFLGGVQLLSLGVIGEYVAKTYIESKRRPRYVVEGQIGSGFGGSGDKFVSEAGDVVDRQGRVWDVQVEVNGDGRLGGLDRDRLLVMGEQKVGR